MHKSKAANGEKQYNMLQYQHLFAVWTLLCFEVANGFLD